MTLVKTFEDAWGKHEVYLVKHKENENEIVDTFLDVVIEPNGERRESTKTEKQQKFLCVNGELVGKKETLEKAEVLGYTRYNCGASGHRWGLRKDLPKCVLVKF